MRILGNIETALAWVSLLWVVYFIGLASPFDLRSFGIIPRNLQCLPGIIFSPLLHAGISHLLSNSAALVGLLSVSLIYSRKFTLQVVVITVLVGGSLVWLLGAGNTVHIGSSGVIFGLIGSLMSIGFFRRELLALTVSLVVLFYYGWALHALFVPLPGVSWSGHFFGFASGVLAAWWTRKDVVKGA